MKFAVDRIEENIAILEELESKIKKEVDITQLPNEIKEGSILKYTDNLYQLDVIEEENRRQNIKERFSRLKKH